MRPLLFLLKQRRKSNGQGYFNNLQGLQLLIGVAFYSLYRVKGLSC